MPETSRRPLLRSRGYGGPDPRQGHGPWLRATSIAVAMAIAPSAVAAQRPARLFPERDLLPYLLAPPRDPVVRGQLVYADPNPTAYGPGGSGEVAVAATIPVLLLSGASTDDALVVGMEGAAFAHFSFQVVERELVNTDWVFAVPLVWRHGGHWLRLRYYHTSSHLGDEYQRRFGPTSINSSRDGIDLTGYFRAGPSARGLGLYAGGMWSPNSHPEEGTVWRGHAGFELDPSEGRPWRPWAALDVELEEASEHGARWTAQAGIWLPPVHARPVRLLVEAMAGPSAMGQLARHETRQVALGLAWNP